VGRAGLREKNPEDRCASLTVGLDGAAYAVEHDSRSKEPDEPAVSPVQSTLQRVLPLERERHVSKLRSDGLPRVLNLDYDVTALLEYAHSDARISYVGPRIVEEDVDNLDRDLGAPRIELIALGELDGHRDGRIRALETLQKHARIAVGRLERDIARKPAADPRKHIEAAAQLSDRQLHVLQRFDGIGVDETDLV
jgi:hypothetical protein